MFFPISFIQATEGGNSQGKGMPLGFKYIEGISKKTIVLQVFGKNRENESTVEACQTSVTSPSADQKNE